MKIFSGILASMCFGLMFLDIFVGVMTNDSSSFIWALAMFGLGIINVNTYTETQNDEQNN